MAYIEDKLLNEKYWRIGWAIYHMTPIERIWWALTGRHKYMTWRFWEERKNHD